MALINCPRCGEKISDKAYECVHCGYSAKREAEEAKRREAEKRRAQQIREEQERQRVLSEQRKAEYKIKFKKYAIVFGVGFLMLCITFGAGNVIYSKVCFDKAVKFLSDKDLKNGEKYLKKSKKTWLNVSDYKSAGQVSLKAAKQCIGNGEYKKALSYLESIQDHSVSISEIKDIYINAIFNFQDWNEESEALFHDMETILNKKDESIFGKEEKKEVLDSFCNQAIEKDNFKKAGNILLYEFKNNYYSFKVIKEKMIPVIYQTAVKNYERGEYILASDFFHYIVYNYEDTLKYMEKLSLYESIYNGLCDGRITIHYIARDDFKEFKWNEEQQQLFAKVTDYINRLQGCYQSGSDYIYVAGYEIYYGSANYVHNYEGYYLSGNANIKNHQTESVEFGNDYFISINSESQLAVEVHDSKQDAGNNKIYQRIGIDQLPSSFDKYVKK